MEIYYIWLIFACFFLVLEIFTESFFVCWFGVGALVSMLISFITPENYILQIIVGAAVSVILIFFTKKFVKKVGPPDVPSNVYTILGKKAVVITEIDNASGKGQIKVDGDIWSAKSENGEKIAANSNVEILRVDGVKVIVK